jgi:hypothetical protein
MIHLIWYIVVGLIAGFVAKSVMHMHLTLVWDGNSRDRRFTRRWMRNSHVFTPEGGCSVSSRRHNFLHTWSPSRFVRLVQAQTTCLKCSRYF